MEKEAFLDFEAIDADNFSNFNTGAPCILGIDEAGRGPVLGPMVYGCAIVPADKMEDLKSLGVNDSKILSRSQREKVITKMEASEFVTYSLRIVHPRTISAQMQRRTRLSLNEISHNCIIGLIQHALKRICIQEVLPKMNLFHLFHRFLLTWLVSKKKLFCIFYSHTSLH